MQGHFFSCCGTDFNSAPDTPSQTLAWVLHPLLFLSQNVRDLVRFNTTKPMLLVPKKHTYPMHSLIAYMHPLMAATRKVVRMCYWNTVPGRSLVGYEEHEQSSSVRKACAPVIIYLDPSPCPGPFYCISIDMINLVAHARSVQLPTNFAIHFCRAHPCWIQAA